MRWKNTEITDSDWHYRRQQYLLFRDRQSDWVHSRIVTLSSLCCAARTRESSWIRIKDNFRNITTVLELQPCLDHVSSFGIVLLSCWKTFSFELIHDSATASSLPDLQQHLNASPRFLVSTESHVDCRRRHINTCFGTRLAKLFLLRHHRVLTPQLIFRQEAWLRSQDHGWWILSGPSHTACVSKTSEDNLVDNHRTSSTLVFL